MRPGVTSLEGLRSLVTEVIVYLMVNFYLDSRGNPIANACTQTRLLWNVAFISYITNPGLFWSSGDA